MTQIPVQLYRLDPYMREFDATVTRIGENYVTLDRTCFYPQGGGQAGDTGQILGTRVLNTIIEEGEIRHVTGEKPPFKPGQLIHGELDWERRLRIMRLHSASHLVYYAMQEVFGSACKPASSGMLDEAKDRSDYLFNEPLDKAKLATVEERVNHLVADSLPITHATAEESGGRLMWRIEPFPPMACGGTHVKNTAEIGRIVLKRGSKPGRGRERVELTLA
jgi:alanyl-tRNA synthetase